MNLLYVNVWIIDISKSSNKIKNPYLDLINLIISIKTYKWFLKRKSDIGNNGVRTWGL